MSNMPNDFNNFGQPPVVKKSNTKLIVIIILVVLLLVLLCCGGMIAMPFLGIYMVKGTAESSARQMLVQSAEAKEALGDVSEVSFSFESTTQAVSKHQGETNWFGCDVKGTQASGDVYVHLGPDMKTVLEAELVLEDGTTIPLSGEEGAELEIEEPSMTPLQPSDATTEAVPAPQ